MKTALVTGSTSGIGLDIGMTLLENDYNVTFNGRTWNKLEAIKKRYPYYEKKIELWCADLSNIYEVYSKCELVEVEKEIESLDVLVLNAGYTDRTEFGEIKLHEWEKVFDTNLTVPFFLVQALKDKINKNGRIIFISSVLADYPHSRSISYGVSKAGVNALVQNLVKFFAHKNITVNAISPGFVSTDWHKNKSKNQIDKIKNKIALKRFGETFEISSLVQEIIRNQYINGSIIDINGGYSYE